MKLLPLHKLGARETSPGIIDFGLYLPWVSAKDSNRLWVKVIHERDQFLQDIQPMIFELTHTVDMDYGDYWSARITITEDDKPHPKSSWGSQGRYVYRYCLKNPNIHEIIDWIIDPFSREFGIGKLSAFTMGYEAYTWSDNENIYKTPELEELIMYELNISEFGGDIKRTIALLDYLADLGINCVELMPVSNVSNTVDWGYLPIGYFGVDERFGKRKDMQRLIDEAHQRGIAVILDSVYGHTSESFPYSYVYRRLNYHENPFMGSFAKDYFGESTDFNRAITRDFFFTVNHHWLDCYHVDGFRYDCVPNYWDGPTGNGFANLVYETYQFIKATDGSGHWQRFFKDGRINVIQCAEQLECPREILEKTYSNCTWQDETLGAAKGIAHGNRLDLTKLGLQSGLLAFPEEVTINNDSMRKTALQYIENHDHSRFICNFETLFRGNELLGGGNRELWYKIQPYLIALFTAKGIPMIWQGQEFCENYYIPHSGWGRVMIFRPVRWDYFYDPIGKTVISLIRKLIRLRRSRPQFRYGEHFFYNDYEEYQSKGVILFSRRLGSNFSLIALNFSDQEQKVSFAFPVSGDYQEDIHGYDNITDIVSGVETRLFIPGNYGRIWTLKTGS